SRTDPRALTRARPTPLTRTADPSLTPTRPTSRSARPVTAPCGAGRAARGQSPGPSFTARTSGTSRVGPYPSVRRSDREDPRQPEPARVHRASARGGVLGPGRAHAGPGPHRPPGQPGLHLAGGLPVRHPDGPGRVRAGEVQAPGGAAEVPVLARGQR